MKTYISTWKALIIGFFFITFQFTSTILAGKLSMNYQSKLQFGMITKNLKAQKKKTNKCYNVTFCESRSFPYFHGKTWSFEAASELTVSTKLLLGIDFI